jgi:hypothetical protein
MLVSTASYTSFYAGTLQMLGFLRCVLGRATSHRVNRTVRIDTELYGMISRIGVYIFLPRCKASY